MVLPPLLAPTKILSTKVKNEQPRMCRQNVTKCMHKIILLSKQIPG